MVQIPWFKIDDTFAMHEKVMAAGNSAIGLWARAGAWSMQQLTDGFVPDHVLRALGTPKERRQLVEVSLWDEAEGGVTFRNWSERQPTKDQVEAARQAAADRQRHARERAKSQRESRRDTGVSHGPPDPTRPDPTPKGKGITPLPDKSGETNRFDEFWDTYGKKVKRADAEKKWAKALAKADADRIISAAHAYVTYERANNGCGRFIADPSTWLHGERWRDERTDLPLPRTRVQEHLSLVQQLAAEEAASEQAALEIGYRQ